MTRDALLIMDFGGNAAQNIARKIRAEKIYCEVVSGDIPASRVRELNPAGLVMAGSVPGGTAPDPGIWTLDLPVLGIGYGARHIAQATGARATGQHIDDHLASVDLPVHPLFDKASGGMRRIAHADGFDFPEGVSVLTALDGIALCFASDDDRLYGVQFIPEQNDPDGSRMLVNFAALICGCRPTWIVSSFIEDAVARIREQVGEGHALLGISGGIDSAVCSALMNRAMGMRLHCLFIDTGLMRKGERAEVERVFRDQLGIDLRCIDASARFMERLKGVVDPTEKRRVIAEEFLAIFEEQAARMGVIDYLVQGTNYSDVLEAGTEGGETARSHHTISWMPENIQFKAILEPVRTLFKDEVRLLGEALELPPSLVWRQPFPGSGLAVRCVGEVTRERLDILRDADLIFRSEIASAGIERQLWQYFAVLTQMQSGAPNAADEYTVILRAVHSADPLSAPIFRVPYDLLGRAVRRILAELPQVKRVVYDLSPKPPAGIEWE